MSHGSNPPPSRCQSLKRDSAPAPRNNASATPRYAIVKDRESVVNPGMSGGLQAGNLFAATPDNLIFSRRDTAFRDGGLTNVTA